MTTLDLSFLHRFCREYEYPAQAEEALTAAAEAVRDDPGAAAIFDRWIGDYTKDKTHALRPGLDELRAYTPTMSVATETVELLFFILCAQHLEAMYAANNYPRDWYRTAMIDLRCKLMECHTVKGIWGSFVADWFCGFFSLDRLALGRLQYELTTMPCCDSEDGRHHFDGTEIAVNVHIPSMGPLLEEDVENSFALATIVYAPLFGSAPVRFCCLSWLLFQSNREILPTGSRILQFMNHFEPVRTELDPHREDLWRIFGTLDIPAPEQLPRDTSLQRAYADWLIAGNPVGMGLGVSYRTPPATLWQTR